MFFRAFFAVRPLSSPSGLPTNAIYGFLTMILKLLKSEKPTHLVFCYDLPTPSFRKQISDTYKANRAEMPEDLAPQIPVIKKLGQLLGIPAFEVEGFEADDVIGTLAEQARQQNWEAYIVSGDKDFCQLLKPGVFLQDTMKMLTMDSKAVLEKYGVRVEQFIDYLALVGDASDNVPGVAGIGPKTAVTLLQRWESLDNIYSHLSEVSPESVQKKLRTHQEQAFTSRKLVEIRLDVPLQRKFSDCWLQMPDLPELQKLLNELDFKAIRLGPADVSWMSPPSTGEHPQAAPAIETSALETAVPRSSSVSPAEAVDPQTKTFSEVMQFLNESVSSRAFWMHVESNGPLDHLRLQMCSHQTWEESQPLDLWLLEISRAELQLLVEHPRVQCMGYDLKSWAHQMGLQRIEVAWDSMLAAYLLSAGENISLERLCDRYLRELPAVEPQQNLLQSFRLGKVLRAEVEKIQGLRILEELDFDTCEVLFQMENRGICLDVEFLRSYSKELTRELAEVESKIFEISKMPFNVASPKQLSQVLFDRLALPPSKKTKTGFSTDNEVLEKLRHQHPIIEFILEHRELAKLKSTYVDALPSLVKEDGRLHTSFHQALTATGRLSSSDPNLQNIPIRSVRGARVREAFVAAPGKLLLTADYSQIELRVLAHYSQDPALIEAFQRDQDIHATTASEIFGVSVESISSEQRRVAKAVNFGIAYGQGAFGLAETLGISRSESQGIIQRYFAKFPGVKSYIENTIQRATQTLYVETLMGRRRVIKELASQNPAVKKFGERAAINAPIQGTASDIVKKAMIELRDLPGVSLLLQIHDELIFEASPEELRDARPFIIEKMEKAFSLKVPLKVNIGMGSNWSSASH